MRFLTLHFAAGWALALATLALMAWYVPLEEKVLGQSYLIFFYHFPSAISCLLFFALAGALSAAHLKAGSRESDQGALAAVEVGLVACAVTLVTGSIWAKAAWGTFWVWHDPRLMTVAVMFFTYLGYLFLRYSIESASQRGRYAAVFGIIAAVNIPLVWYSIRLFGKVSHPMKVEFDPRMREVQWFGLLAFLVLYAAFWRTRARVARVRDEAMRLEETLVLKGL